MKERKASCTCGQLSLLVRGDPKGVTVCHCFACQARTGSTYGVQATFSSGMVAASGSATEYVRTGDAGSVIRYYFCPKCGSTVYYQIDDEPVTVVPVGAFSDPGFPAPTCSVYEERMHQWVSLPEGVEHIF